jgi:hypothetical protein
MTSLAIEFSKIEYLSWSRESIPNRETYEYDSRAISPLSLASRRKAIQLKVFPTPHLPLRQRTSGSGDAKKRAISSRTSLMDPGV